jgi:YaiO family outer membrane protein
MPLKKRFCFILWLCFCVMTIGARGQERLDRDAALKKASAALSSQSFSEAIKICLEQLTSAPDDYELNFLLARAYSYSGDWENGQRTVDRILAKHPDNTDVLLLGARLKFWKKDNRGAEEGFARVLRLKPDDAEALMGLADLAAFEGRWNDALNIYQKIIQLYPEAAEAYFKLGRFYQGQGDYQKARENFQMAASLDPANADFRNVLSAASARLPKCYELRYQTMIESFNDGRKDYLSQQLVFQFELPRKIGPLLLKYNHTRRFQEGDSQVGLEFYPKLGSKAYGYFDFGYSSQALHYPRSSYLFELYQGLLTSAELSFGYRRMNFPAESLSLFMGSFATYFGNYYAVWRWYYKPGEETRALSWFAQLRRYFASQNFIYLGYGRGSRPFDIVTVQDLLVHDSWIFLSGLVWYLWDKIRVELHFSRIEDANGPRRDTFFITTGYRW